MARLQRARPLTVSIPMSTLHRSAFTRPALLAALDPALLRAFLAPHAAFFAARGVALDPAPDPAALVGVFMEPGPDTPPGLVEALHCIKELSAPATADALIAEAARLGLTLPPAATQPEIAMRLWLADPAAVITLHAKHSMLRVRSFEYYSSVGDDPEPPRPAADTLAARSPSRPAPAAPWPSARKKPTSSSTTSLPTNSASTRPRTPYATSTARSSFVQWLEGRPVDGGRDGGRQVAFEEGGHLCGFAEARLDEGIVRVVKRRFFHA